MLALIWYKCFNEKLGDTGMFDMISPQYVCVSIRASATIFTVYSVNIRVM